MPKTREQKEETVKSLTDKLVRAKSLVFTDYKGLNTAQLSNLRDKLRESNAEFNITKNNLLKIAIENYKLKIENSLFEGPTATLFSYEDEITPIKVLVKALKDASKGSIKAGLVEGEFMDDVQINRIALLPPRDELRAKIVGSLGTPLYRIVGVLQANLKNLVYAIEQVRLQKGGETN